MNIYHQPWKLVQNNIRGAGGREIDKFRGLSPAVDSDTRSESWIGSVTKVAFPPPDRPYWGCSEVILPDAGRMFLFEAIALAPERILGKKHMARHGTNLGVLIKYLDAQKQYLLQAHPTRSWAKKMWGSDFGKVESWYIIGTRDDTSEPAYILLGFKEGITRQILEELYRKEDMAAMEKLCHKIPVKAGDVFFIDGGVPHALGAGCFVIEVQEPSDITVVPIKQEIRVKQQKGAVMESEAIYEEKMLGSFIYDGCGYEENSKRRLIPNKLIRQGAWGKEKFIIGPDQTSYFSYTQIDLSGHAEIIKTGFPQVGITLAGEGWLHFKDGSLFIKKGDELFFPYDIPSLAVEGDCSLILCHPEGAYY
jgi:mannose-6-phosphate isomerase